jgi:hypothetical protein
MKIYDDQIAALREGRSAEFERRLVRFVREKVSMPMKRDVHEGDIRDYIAEAGVWALDTERQIAAYVLGVWTFGDEFRVLLEPMKETLADDWEAPDTKATAILEAFDSLWIRRFN